MVIDYLALYEVWRKKPADDWEHMQRYAKLHQWREHALAMGLIKKEA
jgi:hypothetical protein